MKLKPCEVSAPETSGPLVDVFRAMIVFFALSELPLLKIPPPLPVLMPVVLLETVLLVSVTAPLLLKRLIL